MAKQRAFKKKKNKRLYGLPKISEDQAAALAKTLAPFTIGALIAGAIDKKQSFSIRVTQDDIELDLDPESREDNP